MKGLYEIYSGEAVLYVGESGDVYGRWKQHSDSLYEAKLTTLKAIEGGMKADGLKDRDLYYCMAYLQLNKQHVGYRLLLTAETKKDRLFHEAIRIFVCTKLGHKLFNKTQPRVSSEVYRDTSYNHALYFDRITDGAVSHIVLDGKTDYYELNKLYYSEPGKQEARLAKSLSKEEDLLAKLKALTELRREEFKDMQADIDAKIKQLEELIK